MSITDEFARLQDLHESGALTGDEFTAAKAKVLASENTSPAPVQDAELRQDVQRLGLQNQILQLDQDWERERQRLMMRGRYGSYYVPTQGGSLFGAVFAGAVGLMMLAFGANAPNAGPLELFGVAGIVVGIATGVSGTAKADAYQRAEGRYQQRRSELTDQLDRL